MSENCSGISGILKDLACSRTWSCEGEKKEEATENCVMNSFINVNLKNICRLIVSVRMR